MSAQQEKDDTNPLEIMTLAQVEKEAIFEALRIAKGDKVAAARLLGISKTTIYRKLKEYGA